MRAGRSVPSAVTPKAASKLRHSWHLSPLLLSKGDTFPPSSASAGSQEPKLQQRANKLHGMLVETRRVPTSHPIASPPSHLHTDLHKPSCHCCAACHTCCLPSLAVPSLLQPQWERGPACPVPALSGCLAVPMGLPPSLLPTAHEPPPLSPALLCLLHEGAFDLNLSARIRVRSCSPLPSTESHQGCEAASAMVGYLRGVSARAAAVAGQRGTRR